jgi:hypothetical protein
MKRQCRTGHFSQKQPQYPTGYRIRVAHKSAIVYRQDRLFSRQGQGRKVDIARKVKNIRPQSRHLSQNAQTRPQTLARANRRDALYPPALPNQFGPYRVKRPLYAVETARLWAAKHYFDHGN